MTTPNWTIDDSAELYGIRQWGGETFDLNSAGQLTISARFADGKVTLPLSELVAGATARGLDCPLLMRIENLLDAQISLINDSFAAAIAETGYQGCYRGVFPVKVNQQAQVIEEICRYGQRYRHGLEAGSKAELLLALANLNEGGLLICNGYKDQQFIDLGLWGRKLGIDCIFVIESPSELPLIFERSQALGIEPLLGLRIKVAAKVGGLWTETSGDRSSFGLSTAQLVAVVDELRQAGKLDWLQLLHCHLGSQIPDIADIAVGVREASRFYAELASEGVPLRYLDLGGGLAVDYIGNQSGQSHSRNYTLNEYCRTLVKTVSETLDARQVRHPDLVTESGRATVAHSSILLFNVLDVLRFEPLSLPATCPDPLPELIVRQFALHQLAPTEDIRAIYHEALSNRDQIREMFRNGLISLRERSLAENLFLSVARQTLVRLDTLNEDIQELSDLPQQMADIYYGNFSVFQSLPDTWAIGQNYPVLPIQRLSEKPTRDAIIADLTCDCDGKLDSFHIGGKKRRTLPLHELNNGQDYIIGVFLMGAYQETLGDLHNLFGDTNVVSIRIDQSGSFDVTHEQNGDSVAEVLSAVEFNPDSLYQRMRKRAEEAVQAGNINLQQRQQFLNQFASRLRGSTYFNQTTISDDRRKE